MGVSLPEQLYILTSTPGGSGASCLLPVFRLRGDCLCIGVKKKKLDIYVLKLLILCTLKKRCIGKSSWQNIKYHFKREFWNKLSSMLWPECLFSPNSHGEAFYSSVSMQITSKWLRVIYLISGKTMVIFSSRVKHLAHQISEWVTRTTSSLRFFHSSQSYTSLYD